MIETFQDEWELEQLVDIFDSEPHFSVLEIGAWHGGTLCHWLKLGRKVVVIDDEMRSGLEWLEWAKRERCDLTLLQGLSQDKRVVRKARKLGPYDFLFIDGDHTSESVRADWKNYAPMVRGVIVFHDIQPREDYGVSDLWAELKPGRRTVEIWAGVPGYCGIGVLWT